jgi:septum formation protein
MTSVRQPDFLYLASQSPRRAQLLTQLGVPHRVLAPAPGEDAEALEVAREGEAPARYVARVTRLKLLAARERLALRSLVAAPILCSDTTVALGTRILGKPAHAREASAMLRTLSGQTHRVLTAVAIGWTNGRGQWQEKLICQVSRVRWRTLSSAEIAAYVRSGEPFGKAGAYAIQGGAAAFTEHISGSYSGIMGLPLFELAALLRHAGCAHLIGKTL